MRPPGLATLTCLALLGCPDDNTAGLGEAQARQVKERVDRERADAERRIPGSTRPTQAARTPDFTKLSTPSACDPDLAIPLFPALAPGVCFGQSPEEVSAAWTKVPFDLMGTPSRQTASVAVGHQNAPFSRVTLEFENGTLASVELVPVESRDGAAAIGRALEAALGSNDKLVETNGGHLRIPFATVRWLHDGSVHAYFRGSSRSDDPASPVSLWRENEVRDAFAAERYKAAVLEQNRRDLEGRAAAQDPF